MSNVRPTARWPIASIMALALASSMRPPNAPAHHELDRRNFTRAEAKQRRRNRARNKMARISRRINRKRARS